MTLPIRPAHPGAKIREHVIPVGMSVTDAAKRLGIGRPALSSLLNGKSSLSPKMALRLEKTFGTCSSRLLALQANYDEHCRSTEKNELTVRPYVPAILTITAGEIHHWANNADSRRLLPVLLRKLVASTSDRLLRADFPGYDNAENPGWDGWTEVEAATPWIPIGQCGWEFGTSQYPRRKADNDYIARLRSTPEAKRADSTFVFVTPRNWPAKKEWENCKRSDGNWKDVRAYDASDIEQWLEHSIPAQLWLTEQFGKSSKGFETLDSFWHRWTTASNPELTPTIFKSSVKAHRDEFKRWLTTQSGRMLTVSADSQSEAIALLHCLFNENKIGRQHRDLPIVFKSSEVLRSLVESKAQFIPIVSSWEAEQELASAVRDMHCISIHARNAVNSNPDIVIEPPSYITFNAALTEMGIGHDRADRLARESGHSPTILRRRLSTVTAIRTPGWARSKSIAKSLVPMVLIGAWHKATAADREVVSLFVEGKYKRIETQVAQLLRLDDTPIWSIGQYCGVTSKIDALFAISGSITSDDIENFFFIAEYVLSEKDPALDLPKSQRWAAGLYEKVRNHSRTLRNGICETLVLLSVHGNDLFRNRLNIRLDDQVSSLIRALLDPISFDKLLSQQEDLAQYAEAAPETFLKIIESDLETKNPVVFRLLEEVKNPLFEICTRTGLLQALECLAWKHLGRSTTVLAKLSRTTIDDNIAQTPIASLYEIFRSWIPQTAASLDERIHSLKHLAEKFPEIGWKICMDQLNSGQQTATPTYRPRWRNDATGAGSVVSNGERRHFQRKALDIALEWNGHDKYSIADLVKRIPIFPSDDRSAVWKLVDNWAESETDDLAKAEIRKQIRICVFAHRTNTTLNPKAIGRAKKSYDDMAPHSIAIRDAWIFSDYLIEFEVVRSQSRQRELFGHKSAGIERIRAKLIFEIWTELGIDGITSLLNAGGVPTVVGRSAAVCFKKTAKGIDFLRSCLSVNGKITNSMSDCIFGYLSKMDDKLFTATFETIAKNASDDELLRFFNCAPFKYETWRMVDLCKELIRTGYWNHVIPQWRKFNDDEVAEIIDCLLQARRPDAAFYAVQYHLSQVETAHLKRLLTEFGTAIDEPSSQFQIDAYHIVNALKTLNRRDEVTQPEMVALEFMYLPYLDNSDYGVLNLEHQIANAPIIFLHALALAFKRNDDRTDPTELQIEDPTRRVSAARTAFQLLMRFSRIPGTGEGGKIDQERLLAWTKEARRLCAEYGRAKIGDQIIGQILSHAPEGEDGSWPCLSVCTVLENVASHDIGIGLSNGVHNRPGLRAREIGVGGARERELAKRFRNWSKQREFSFPFASGVLISIASDYERTADYHDDEHSLERRRTF